MGNEDRRKDLLRSYVQAADVVEGIRQDQLGAPTPCPEYDVANLVDHIVGAGQSAAVMGRGETPAGGEFAHVELSDAPGELRQAAKDAEAAWADDERLTATVTMPWGEVYTGYTVVNLYLAELAGHAWDIAASTGQLDRLDPELAAGALGGARSMLKPEYRDMMGKGNPFGAEIEAPPGASDWERFAAFMGRDPRARS